MEDLIIAYVAGQEISRAHANKKGHVLYNQETYLKVTDFYNDAIQKTCILGQEKRVGEWWQKVETNRHYKICYRAIMLLQTIKN